MKLYAFRVVNPDTGKPTGYKGFVSAANKAELFVSIDRFTNPYAVQIQEIPAFGMCWHEEEYHACPTEKEKEREVADVDYSCFEGMEDLVGHDDEEAWHNPKFPEPRKIYRKLYGV